MNSALREDLLTAAEQPLCVQFVSLCEEERVERQRIKRESVGGEAEGGHTALLSVPNLQAQPQVPGSPPALSLPLYPSNSWVFKSSGLSSIHTTSDLSGNV